MGHGNFVMPRRSSNTGLAIGVGIAQGIDNAVKNLYTIQGAKQKLQQEQEMHDADLKVKKAQLDKLELIYGPEQIAAEREKLKAETSANTALFNLRNVQIAREQEKNKMALDTHQKAMMILDNVLKNKGALPPGMRINSNGDFSIAGQKAELDLSGLINGTSNDGTEMPGTVPAGSAPVKSDWWNQ